ncbi:MAG: hypothetical protein IJ451_00230, partial [Ruminococcus sp.]|nr:hypothetical protein [Ruminococcus sp.]
QRQAFYDNAGLTEGCCRQLLSKEPADCSSLCRAVWYFCATKVHDRTTTRRINYNRLRVKTKQERYRLII